MTTSKLFERHTHIQLHQMLWHDNICESYKHISNLYKYVKTISPFLNLLLSVLKVSAASSAASVTFTLTVLATSV